MRHLILLAALAIPGCASPMPAFDGARSYADLVHQTDFGPRIPGSPGHVKCGDWIAEELRQHADSSSTQHFTGTILGSRDSIPMRNFIAHFNPGSSTRILISAHWDTRPFADRDPDSTLRRQPVPGANDAGSGVAVLLELARLFDSLPPPVGVDLVFYDGEDGGEYSSSPGTWCQGSFYFASHLPTRYKWAINLDMIGDKDLHIPLEGHSYRLTPDLIERVWKKAEELHEPAFQRSRGDDVFDDHMPLLMKGIGAIDLIDFDYPHWHTTHDTADKCSAASLATIGRVLVGVIYDM